MNESSWQECLMLAVVCGLHTSGPRYSETLLAQMADLPTDAQAILRAFVKAAEDTEE